MNNTQTNNNSIRTLWIDIAKAIAIFCIVMGHAASGSEVIMYRNVLYSFHVALFFILSGLSMKYTKEENFNIKGVFNYLKKNFLILVVPYLFWGILLSNFSLTNILPILYGSYQKIKTVSEVGALWFVPCFVVARLLTQSIIMLVSKAKYKLPFLIPIMIVLFTIGFLLPSLDNGYPWSINIAFVGSGFLLLGFILKDVLKKLGSAKIWIQIIVFVCSIVGFYFGSIFRGSNFELVCMYKGVYGNIFWMFYNALFGSTVIISLSMIISKMNNWFTKALQYVGMQTFGILFIHVPIMRQLMIPLFEKIGFTDPKGLVAFLAAICSLLISLLIDWCILKVCPELVGKKKQTKQN